MRLSETSASTAAFFRVAYALPVLLMLWLPARKKDSRSFRQRAGAFLAGVVLGVDLVAWHHAIDAIGAGVATVLGNTQVFFVALAAWWLYGERPRKVILWVLPLMFAGVILASGLGRADAYGAAPSDGVLLGLATGVLYSIFLLVFRRSAPSDGLPIGPWLDATVGTLASVWLLSLYNGDLNLTWVWPAHGWLIALALIAQVFGWLLITKSLRKMPAIETSVLLLAQPVLTLTWGWILLGERLSSIQIGGTLLVLLGIGLLSIPRNR